MTEVWSRGSVQKGKVRGDITPGWVVLLITYFEVQLLKGGLTNL